jgi:hypothetical protein
VLPVVEGALHIAVRARNAPEVNELSFAVGDKLLVLKVDAAHQRVMATNESRGSVSGWAPLAAIRPATDAEIASRVSGVSTGYVASLGSSSGTPPPSSRSPLAESLPDVVGAVSTSNYSSGVSQMKFPSADSLPAVVPTTVVRSSPAVPTVVVRNSPSNRVGFIAEASAEPQYGIRPRGPVSDPYGSVSGEAAERIDQMAAVFATPTPVQREGVATGYAASRPAAPLPVHAQREGIAQGYSSQQPQLYTRPPSQSPRGAPAPAAGGEQYGSLQLRPADDNNNNNSANYF